ncbi:uncharacterized protein LOC128990332 [Macrosteles quadrilineatus]|uniref:uncharacterized protein LOC128990332 n=1 Tax=Macrosteles quadrilineatus TaxID=74068 RepID=UPI0023E31104|nr:uncharacterized protein LOC128990332 [Macrosteles quadrilineatus]
MLPTALVVVLAAVIVQISDAKAVSEKGRVEELTLNLDEAGREIEDKSSKEANTAELTRTYGHIKFGLLKKRVEKHKLKKTLVFLVKRYFLHMGAFIMESIMTPIQIIWASKYRWIG